MAKNDSQSDHDKDPDAFHLNLPLEAQYAANRIVCPFCKIVLKDRWQAQGKLGAPGTEGFTFNEQSHFDMLSADDRAKVLRFGLHIEDRSPRSRGISNG